MTNLQIEYVVMVAELRSFSRAAEKLSISQPALSSYIAKIERDIGKQLFDRSTSPLKVTDVGVEYIKHAKEIKAIKEEFKRYVSGKDEMQSGKVNIGCSQFFSCEFISNAIAEFCEKHPNVEVVVHEDALDELSQKTSSGELDMFISFEQDKYEVFNAVELFSEKLLLAVPEKFCKDNGLSDKCISKDDILSGNKYPGPIDLKDMPAIPFIFLNTDTSMLKKARKLVSQKLVRVSSEIHVANLSTAYSLASDGVGATLVPESVVKYGNNIKTPCFFELDSELCNRTVSIFIKKNKYQSKAIAEFTEIIKEKIK